VDVALVGVIADVCCGGREQAVAQLGQCAGSGELVTDLGNVGVGRVEPGQPDPDQVIGVACVQPCDRARVLVALVDDDGDVLTLRFEHVVLLMSV